MTKRSVYIFMDMIYGIGGAETWLYHLTNLLKDDFDVKVLYRTADGNQLARLNVPHEQYNNIGNYECDILLNLFTGRPMRIKAKHYVQTVHSNYGQMPWYRFEPWDRTDSYIFASEEAREYFPLSLDNVPNVVLTNPLCAPEGIKKVPRTDDKKLKIMAATRLTEEKGGARLVQLVRQIHEAQIGVELHIWTNWDFYRFNNTYDMKELRGFFYFHQPELNLMPKMAEFDYVAQFSDCEAFCYTIHESLAVHTPVLVTDWEGVRKCVRNGLNGYIYDMNMNGPSPKELLNRPNVFGLATDDTSSKWKKYLQNLPLIHDIQPDRHWYFR